MRFAATITGILGGLFGIFSSIMVLSIGYIGTFFSAVARESKVAILGGVIALLSSILSIIGSSLIFYNPKKASLIILSSAFLGLLSISLAYSISFVLLVFSGITAHKIGKNENKY